MKTLLEDLIVGKYYMAEMDIDEIYYFKYSHHDSYDLYGYGLQIVEDLTLKQIEYYYDTHLFTMYWYHRECEVLKEIDLDKIVDKLPDNDPDKINYLRNNKINYLLSL